MSGLRLFCRKKGQEETTLLAVVTSGMWTPEHFTTLSPLLLCYQVLSINTNYFVIPEKLIKASIHDNVRSCCHLCLKAGALGKQGIGVRGPSDGAGSPSGSWDTVGTRTDMGPAHQEHRCLVGEADLQKITPDTSTGDYRGSEVSGWPKSSFGFFHTMALVALCLKLHLKQYC